MCKNNTCFFTHLLVAQTIDEKAMDELHILCSGHNVGLIQLDCENPSESQILLPAIEKKT